MIDYTAEDLFTETQIYDLVDLVKGGSNGESNIPLKALLDRTYYLKNRLYRYDSQLLLQASATVDSSVVGKFVSVKAISSNVVVTLAALSSFEYGYVLPIAATCGSIFRNVTVQGSNGELIYLSSSYTDNKIYMHDGDVLYLLRDTATWTVIAY